MTSRAMSSVVRVVEGVAGVGVTGADVAVGFDFSYFSTFSRSCCAMDDGSHLPHLSLDGGGAKGFYSLGVLEELEALLDRRPLCLTSSLSLHASLKERPSLTQRQDWGSSPHVGISNVR